MKKILIDTDIPCIDTDYSWQMGIGCDHAHQLLRTDVTNYLKIAHDELGIKSVRFHGMFDDDMKTYCTFSEMSPMNVRMNSVKDINFRQCAFVIDNIRAAGMEPFMELSFMPNALAKGKPDKGFYQKNRHMPRKMDEWREYIRLFIQFLEDRYGAEVVRKWYFEIWNEPDLGVFFEGKQEDYFILYQATAETIKSVDSEIMVGGPSTSACRWIDEFINYCETNKVPFDFVSTHHYPGDGFGNLISTSNFGSVSKIVLTAIKEKWKLSTTLSAMFYHPEAAANVPKGILTTLDDGLIAKTKKIPTIMSEWNSMAIFGATIHDEKYSAAFLVKSVLDLKNDFAGYMFWCLSDVFEELTQLNIPFHGGFGIFSIDGIRKPNFWGMKMLSTLYPKRLDMGVRETEAVDYAIFTDGNNYQVMVLAQDNDPRKDEQFEVEIKLPGIFGSVKVEIIDDTHCNPKAMWEELGSPDYLLPYQVEEITKKTWLSAEHLQTETADGVTVIRTSLRTNDIKLYTFEV